MIPSFLFWHRYVHIGYIYYSAILTFKMYFSEFVSCNVGAHHIGLKNISNQKWYVAWGKQTIWMISKNWIDLTKSTWAANFNTGFLVICQHNRRTDATTTKLKLMELSQTEKKQRISTRWRDITDEKKISSLLKPLSTFIYSLSFALSIFA